MATATCSSTIPIHVPDDGGPAQGISFGKLKLFPSLDCLIHEQAEKLIKPDGKPYVDFDTLSPDQSRTVVQKAIRNAQIMAYCTNPTLLKIVGVALAVLGLSCAITLAPLSLIAAVVFPLLYVAGMATVTFGFVGSDHLQLLSDDYQKAAEKGRALLAQLQPDGHCLVLPPKPFFFEVKKSADPIREGLDRMALAYKKPVSHYLSFWK